jgi:hexosaminidase
MMKRILKILAIVLLVLAAGAAIAYYAFLKPKDPPISAEDIAQINLMPLPAALKLNGGEFLIGAGFGFKIEGTQDRRVEAALDRFMQSIVTKTSLNFAPGGKGLTVSFLTPMEEVQPVHADESYEIQITADEVELKAVTGYGVLRGLETLKQLLRVEEGASVWPTATIKDAPRFPWRGVMIDVCRHWIPKEVILRNLEAMASVKMNVFHWHLSEHQAFRVESKVFPKLHEMGSNGEYYTQEDIREIVEFAAARGIRVIPEFDLPGHATSYLVGYPELAAMPGPYKLQENFGLSKPVMDPSKEEVYDFLDQFIGEMAALFPDTYFHMGGDEVDFGDWDLNPSIVAFKQANGIQNNHDLQAYFNQRMEKILTKHGKKMVGWEEIANPNLSKEIVVQSWINHKSLFRNVQAGHQAILSAGYYLDYKLPASKHYELDPEILPGAVTIEPDSLNWNQYEIAIQAGESPMHAEILLYGVDDELRGLFGMKGNYTELGEVKWTGNVLDMSFVSQFGNMKASGELEGDRLVGTLGFGLISIPFKGKLKGSSKLPGTVAPKIEKMEPLTPIQKSGILGGEAAMWTELVSAQTIDSRIWPRTAAIAEKWWSPQELTVDVNDMYRRLEVVSAELVAMGMKHISNLIEMRNELAEGKDAAPVQVLVDVLEEVKYMQRMSLENTVSKPLTDVADAAHAESMKAVKFGQQVDAYLADTSSTQHTKSIRLQLEQWIANHSKFEEVATGNPRLESVIKTSEELKLLAEMSLRTLDLKGQRKVISVAEKKVILGQINLIETTRSGTLLAVEPHLKKLIQAMPEK